MGLKFKLYRALKIMTRELRWEAGYSWELVPTSQFEGVVAQWSNPLTLQPEQLGEVGSKRGRARPFERHDKRSRTRSTLSFSYFCDPGAWR